jgi:transcriptional regulator GlxA family with amidase domain
LQGKNIPAMIVISLMIFDEVVPSSVTGVIDLFNGGNRYLQQIGKEPAFAIELVGDKTKNMSFEFAGRAIPYKTYEQVRHSHLIVVPSFNVGNHAVLEHNKEGIKWIRKMKQAGAEVASLCVGCYFLAEAGLLDGKEATSHWAAIDAIQQQYPAIH